MIEKIDHYRSKVGMEIARREFAPAQGGFRGGLVLLHGIGEHTARYGEVMRRLTGMGLLCAGVDWPGHGLSPGKRGHIESLATVHTLIRETRAYLIERLGGGPGTLAGRVGLGAHSMGALLALDFLGRYHGEFAFAWVNAPPLFPEGKRSRLSIGLLRRLGVPFPRLTVSHGVKVSMCFDASDPEFVARARRNCHNRVSLRLGLTLLETAREVRASSRPLGASLSLLATQGGADKVCLPEHTRKWFDAVPLEDKTYREFPGRLHECWRDAEVVDAAEAWLREKVAS